MGQTMTSKWDKQEENKSQLPMNKTINQHTRALPLTVVS